MLKTAGTFIYLFIYPLEHSSIHRSNFLLRLRLPGHIDVLSKINTIN